MSNNHINLQHNGEFCMILITGGAGYIGSHTVSFLLEKAEDVAVVDNFQKGHEEA